MYFFPILCYTVSTDFVTDRFAVRELPAGPAIPGIKARVSLRRAGRRVGADSTRTRDRAMRRPAGFPLQPPPLRRAVRIL